MSKNKNEIQAKKENNISTEVNTFDMSGFIADGLQKQDLKIETITLAQNNSTILQENTSLRGSNFYTSVSRDKLTDKPEWEFIALYVEPVVQVFENKTGQEDRKLAKKGSYIETIKRKDWGDKPVITRDYVAYHVNSMFVSLVGEDMITEVPFKLNFKSSNMSAFQPIIKTIMKHAKEPGFHQTHLVFKMGTKLVKGEDSSWYTYDVSFSRMSTEEERVNVETSMDILKALDDAKKLDDTSEEVETPIQHRDEELVNYAPGS